MILATLSFTVMVGFVKTARQEMTALEVMCWRAGASVPLAYLLTRRTGIGVQSRRLLGLRVLLGFCAMACYFTAAKGLALGDLTIISKLQPILIALVAPMVFGSSERTGPLVWVTLVAGIIGSAVLIGPELAVGNRFGLWAVGAAGFSAAAHLCVRALGKSEAPEVVVFWFQLGVFALAVPAAFATTGALPVPEPHLWVPLIGCGVTATIGQVLLTRAYAADSAPVVAAASYAAPLWAILADVVVFAVWPSTGALIGGALIVAAGLALVLSRSRAGGEESPLGAAPVLRDGRRG